MAGGIRAEVNDFARCVCLPIKSLVSMTAQRWAHDFLLFVLFYPSSTMLRTSCCAKPPPLPSAMQRRAAVFVGGFVSVSLMSLITASFFTLTPQQFYGGRGEWVLCVLSAVFFFLLFSIGKKSYISLRFGKQWFAYNMAVVLKRFCFMWLNIDRSLECKKFSRVLFVSLNWGVTCFGLKFAWCIFSSIIK